MDMEVVGDLAAKLYNKCVQRGVRLALLHDNLDDCIGPLCGKTQ